ncbi:hypothetical protein H1P_5140001 [Hyella patelloides LEGE 07179]|uniref:Uncharacterized protein n=1 Tax=Hyella patelloides LEGE 07179 TaxID=945734 RepID=A0A563VZU1_9CYAN|nr:hypothetical protein [Hyella patelloides]VEP16946.1 hypothetical protein H1P_5140001 [Hyella patelloides LEGE 07179]
MSNIRDYQLNLLYEKFDVLKYGSKSFSYLRVLQEHEIDYIKSDKGRIKRLELGFAPAVVIYRDFSDFINHTRDF